MTGASFVCLVPVLYNRPLLNVWCLYCIIDDCYICDRCTVQQVCLWYAVPLTSRQEDKKKIIRMLVLVSVFLYWMLVYFFLHESPVAMLIIMMLITAWCHSFHYLSQWWQEDGTMSFRPASKHVFHHRVLETIPLHRRNWDSVIATEYAQVLCPLPHGAWYLPLYNHWVMSSWILNILSSLLKVCFYFVAVSARGSLYADVHLVSNRSRTQASNMSNLISSWGYVKIIKMTTAVKLVIAFKGRQTCMVLVYKKKKKSFRVRKLGQKQERQKMRWARMNTEHITSNISMKAFFKDHMQERHNT